MSKSAEANERRLEYRRDMLTSRHRFRELVDLASEVCLKNPAEVTDKGDLRIDPVVMELGVHGVRAAVEATVSDPSFFSRFGRGRDLSEDSDGVSFSADLPMKAPTGFSDTVDLESLQLATNFGRQLIKESFAVLGQDAHEKARQLASADSVEKQVEVIQWLDSRLSDITDRGDYVGSQPDRNTYHPARLSPKLNGSYPEIGATPTCLGVSIIATSFLQKAGIRTLHAGVEVASHDSVVLNAFVASSVLEEETANRLEPALSVKIDALSGALGAEMFDNEISPHAAVYGQLIDGSWIQIDSNFKNTVVLDQKNGSDTVGLAADTLDEFSGIAPNLQLATRVSGSMNTVSAHMLQLIEDLGRSRERDDLVSLFGEIMNDNDLESVPQKVYDQIIYPFFRDLNSSVFESLYHDVTDEPGVIFSEAFYDSFSKFVLWDQPLEDVAKRMKTDANYRARRIEDIKSLPYMMIGSVIAVDYARQYGQSGHIYVELGLPETRIGLAALNDFGNFLMSDEILTDFWISQWPSSVPPVEFIDQDRTPVGHNASVHYGLMHPFTSFANYGIVERSLSTDEDSAEG